MEKYFIVTKNSRLYKDYWKYKKNRKKVNEIVRRFMDKHDIKASLYTANNQYFFIDPTRKDTDRFDKILRQRKGEGLRAFKKNSIVGKDWIKTLKENELEIVHRPIPMMYFNQVYGKTKSRLFHMNDKVYCSLESNSDIKCPEGMTEIKASEFFKIIEEIKESNCD